MHKVLIIDENADSLSLNKKFLSGKGYIVQSAETSHKALQRVVSDSFDCILTDLIFSEVDGFSLINSFRKKTAAPIIILSSRSAEEDIIRAFNAGADDYITKPYSLNEMAVRINAQIRRSDLNINKLVIDEEKSNIAIGNKIISFSKKEFELLMLFYKNPNKTFSSKEIYSILWKEDQLNSNSVAVYVKRLRNKLEEVSSHFGIIKNSYKLGYYFLPNNNDVTYIDL